MIYIKNENQKIEFKTEIPNRGKTLRNEKLFLTIKRVINISDCFLILNGLILFYHYFHVFCRFYFK